MTDAGDQQAGPFGASPVAPQVTRAPDHERRVAADVRYAGFWRRFWAFWLDILFVLLLAGLVELAIPEPANGGLAWLLIVVYAVVFTALGGTVGKRMLGLRLVRSDGGDLDVVRAAFRVLVLQPISIIGLGFGVLRILDSPTRQAWHDRIVDSVVVREVPETAGPEWRHDPPWRRS